MHLMRQEVDMEIAGEGGGWPFRVTAYGVPMGVLILVKSLCGRTPQH